MAVLSVYKQLPHLEGRPYRLWAAGRLVRAPESCAIEVEMNRRKDQTTIALWIFICAQM